MTVVRGRAKVSSFAQTMHSKCYTKQSSPLNQEKLKRLLYSICFAESVRHSIIPSGIVYTVLWSSSVAIVLGLYTCNLPAWLLAWEEQTGQDSMSLHHLKILAHIKQPWREGTTLPYTLIHFSPLQMFLPHLHSRLTLMYWDCTVLTSSSPTWACVRASHSFTLFTLSSYACK